MPNLPSNPVILDQVGTCRGCAIHLPVRCRSRLNFSHSRAGRAHAALGG